MRARLPPPGRTRPFPARSVESSSPPCPHATQPVRLLPYWDVSAIFVLPSPSDACAPLPAGEDRRRAPTRFVREARGATRVARASAEPACRPSLGPPPGPRGRRFGPPGSKRAVLTPPSGAFVDPTSSRSSVQKYLFTRSSPQVLKAVYTLSFTLCVLAHGVRVTRLSPSQTVTPLSPGRGGARAGAAGVRRVCGMSVGPRAICHVRLALFHNIEG